MGGVKVLGVNPDTLKQAATGINGVIEGISSGMMGSYQGQLGRGFGDLAMTGLEAMARPLESPRRRQIIDLGDCNGLA